MLSGCEWLSSVAPEDSSPLKNPFAMYMKNGRKTLREVLMDGHGMHEWPPTGYRRRMPSGSCGRLTQICPCRLNRAAKSIEREEIRNEMPISIIEVVKGLKGRQLVRRDGVTMPSEAMPPVKELVETAVRAKDYDPEAFSRLFDLFFERMRRYMYYHTGSLDTADELASELFASALESIGSFQDRGGTIGHWLYGIARNLLYEHFRSEGKVVREPLDHAPAVGDWSDPESHALDNLDYEDVYRAVDQLPDEQRNVVILRFIEGYRVGEIASIMGKTPGAVRALQHRAMVSLRKIFVREIGSR